MTRRPRDEGDEVYEIIGALIDGVDVKERRTKENIRAAKRPFVEAWKFRVGYPTTRQGRAVWKFARKIEKVIEADEKRRLYEVSYHTEQEEQQ